MIVSPDRQRPRALVTGFYGGYLAAGRWNEFAPMHNDDWRLTFDPRVGSYGMAAPMGLPRSEYLTAHIIGELRHIGLWREQALAVDPERVAICFTSSKGRMACLETGNVLAPSWDYGLQPWTCDWAATYLSQLTRAQGPLLSPVAACASGSHAIALGAQLIQDDYADVVLCGAIESETPQTAVAGYRTIGALSERGVMRPFDVHRDGFVPAEGLGLLVLESEAHAAKRGVPNLGAVTGWSMLADATHLTAMEPSGSSVARAIEGALKRAGASAPDYINAHGTATARNDTTESRGIFSALGNGVPVSSTKAETGHLFGASGALEAIFCLLAMRDGWAPPTLNLQEPDNECDLDYIANVGRALKIDTAASLNFGFGGNIGVLVLQKE